MDKQSELLIRSALHDMANVLAGVQGILELADPGRPLNPRDRDRLEAVVEEGMATLARTRHLAMGTLPERLVQEGPDWRAQLADELRPMSTLFKCRFKFAPQEGSGSDLWPGACLRSYLRAVTRQVLPYVPGQVLTLHCDAGASAWCVRLRPVTLLPEGLQAHHEDRPGDISSRWALHAGAALGASLSWAEDTLSIVVPRPAGR